MTNRQDCRFGRPQVARRAAHRDVRRLTPSARGARASCRPGSPYNVVEFRTEAEAQAQGIGWPETVDSARYRATPRGRRGSGSGDRGPRGGGPGTGTAAPASRLRSEAAGWNSDRSRHSIRTTYGRSRRSVWRCVVCLWLTKHGVKIYDQLSPSSEGNPLIVHHPIGVPTVILNNAIHSAGSIPDIITHS